MPKINPLSEYLMYGLQENRWSVSEYHVAEHHYHKIKIVRTSFGIVQAV